MQKNLLDLICLTMKFQNCDFTLDVMVIEMIIYFLHHIFSGYATGSTFNDQELKNSYFPGEGIMDGRVIAIKTHQKS